MTVKITLEFESVDAAQDALALLSGEAVETTAAAGKPGRGRKAGAAAATAAGQTAAANTPPQTPAKAAPSIDEAKGAIAAHFGPNTKAGYVEEVTEFVKSFGIPNMTASTEAVRSAMLGKLAELKPAAKPAVDPMS